jgi:hypothetical protein
MSNQRAHILVFMKGGSPDAVAVFEDPKEAGTAIADFEKRIDRESRVRNVDDSVAVFAAYVNGPHPEPVRLSA